MIPRGSLVSRLRAFARNLFHPDVADADLRDEVRAYVELLTDEKVAARVHAIKHGEDVCWQMTQPVSTQFRLTAGMGGLYPQFIGNLERVLVNLYHLEDYDPKVDSRLDSINGVHMRPDGAPTGTWQLHSERPLPAGEYIAVFRLSGSGNWDRQAVLLKLDPKIPPAPKGQ